MEKHNTRKVSFEDCVDRLSHREDISIEQSGYRGWKKKSTFFDRVVGENFESRPCDVLRNGSVHPKRRREKFANTLRKRHEVDCLSDLPDRAEKTKLTSLQKYGVEHPSKSEVVKEKRRRTVLDKYGAEEVLRSKEVQDRISQSFLRKYGETNPGKTEAVKTKRKATLLERYGEDNPSKIEAFQQKKIETAQKNWGVSHPRQSKEVLEKAIQTNLNRYGVSHPMKSSEIKTKVAKANLEKYGKSSFFLTEQHKQNTKFRRVLETGERVCDWLRNQEEPKPALSSLNNSFNKVAEVSLTSLMSYLDTYRSHKTGLEMKAEELFDIPHWNKSIPEIGGKYRPDFKISEGTFLNVDGLYWHSIIHKNKQYHFNLRRDFEEKGLRILQFRENEILDKPQIAKSMVSNLLGKSHTKIMARKCKIQKISQVEADQFLFENHLKGKKNAKHVGLIFDENLVCLLSYKRKLTSFHIERFCTKLFHNVQGGFSRLLKWLESNVSLNKEIWYWVDLRYGSGAFLKSFGFSPVRETLGFEWTDGKMTLNRLRCRAKMDDRHLTEAEYAKEMGLTKIYDAGQRLFVKRANWNEKPNEEALHL